MTRPERKPIPLPDAPPLPVPDDFVARLDALGVVLDAPALTRLGSYLARLLAMNALMNLTAITDPAEVWVRHGLDALSLVPLLADVAEGALVVDIGSGGGVPGIPLSIARPDLRITLVEATGKKAAFLRDVAASLELARVSVVAARAELLLGGLHRGSYDVVTARAVGRLAVLAPITVPFAKAGGRVLLVKGQRADEELAEAAAALRAVGATHTRTVATPTGRIVVLRANRAPAAR